MKMNPREEPSRGKAQEKIISSPSKTVVILMKNNNMVEVVKYFS